MSLDTQFAKKLNKKASGTTKTGKVTGAFLARPPLLNGNVLQPEGGSRTIYAHAYIVISGVYQNYREFQNL